MPVLPPQSPELPVIADRSTAFVSVMSMMSTFWLPVQFVAVMVAGEPRVEDCTSSRLVAELPIMAKVVQVTVVPEVKVMLSVFVAVPLRVSTLQVKAPETVCAVPLRLIDSPLKSTDPPVQFPVPVMFSTAVLAVMEVIPLQSQLDEALITDEPGVKVPARFIVVALIV